MPGHTLSFHDKCFANYLSVESACPEFSESISLVHNRGLQRFFVKEYFMYIIIIFLISFFNAAAAQDEGLYNVENINIVKWRCFVGDMRHVRQFILNHNADDFDQRINGGRTFKKIGKFDNKRIPPVNLQ